MKKLGKPFGWIESQSKKLVAKTNASIVAVGIGGGARLWELRQIASSNELVVPVDNYKKLNKFVTSLTYTASGCGKYIICTTTLH